MRLYNLKKLKQKYKQIKNKYLASIVITTTIVDNHNCS